MVKFHALEIPPRGEVDTRVANRGALAVALVDLEQDAAVGQRIHLAAGVNSDSLAVIGKIAGESGFAVFQVHGADG